MIRDCVANIVHELHRSGCNPLRVGDDSWEARCPVHKGKDRSLAVGRNELNHAVLECRSTQNCQNARIIATLGLTNDRVYAETGEWWISRLARVPIQPPTFKSSIGTGKNEVGTTATEGANGSTEASRSHDSEPSADYEAAETGVRPVDDSVVVVVSGGPTPNEAPVETTGGSNGASSAQVDVSSQAAPTFIDLSLASEILAKYASGNARELSGLDASENAEIKDKIEPEGSLQVLLRLASGAQFFRSSDGRLFAQVPVGTRHEIFGVKSTSFRDWLIEGHFADCGEIPSQWAIRRVLTALEARARFGAETPSVFIRVGHDGTGNASLFFIDLGDSSGRAIAIGPDGWSVVDRPAVHFRRPEGLLALPTPSREGSIELLRPYVNLSDRDFRLMIGWMAAALRPVGPYPILALYGEQAAAKSTLAKVVRLLIDPQDAPLLAIPRGVRQLMVTGHNGWLLAYDNISVIADVVSDGLCMVSTGGAYAGRALFSNDERSVIHVQRPVLLSGIEEFVRRGDLSDRSVYLNLPPIDDDNRRREDEFWPAFQRDQPKILGGLLDAIVGGLRELPAIHLPKLPRMADFAAFGEAVGRTLEWPAGTFLADYDENRRESTATQLEDSIVATVLLNNSHRIDGWSGTASELLSMLAQAVGGRSAASARWPKSPARLTNELRRIAPQLRMHDLTVTFERSSESRLITINSNSRQN